ncbi:MAG: hypothetical protein II563_10540 [Treponema sp.]|nr:hypothetical protein [Treponema sp.]MBQ2553267.1 hypothetical protein [Treponema sp.]
MAKQQRTIGVFVLQLALAIYLVVTGLCLVAPTLGRSISSEEIRAVAEIFKNPNIGKIISIVVGVVLIVCGVMFAIKALFTDLGKIDDVFKYVTLIVWIVVTVITLINCFSDFKNGAVMHWLLVLAKNALIIGGILTIKNGK